MNAYQWKHREDRKQAMDVLARTLIGEADAEDLPGLAAVAWVIRTRAERGGWYGSDIYGVCRAPWQFSCWNHNDPNYPRISSDWLDVTDNYYRAYGVACLVMMGEMDNPAPDADHYYCPELCAPAWKDKYREIAVVGGHRFLDSRQPVVTTA